MEPKILKRIFNELGNENYCIIKLDPALLGKNGGDVDMYCENVAKIGRKILLVGNKLLQEKIYDDIKIIEEKNFKHAYIDFYKNSELKFRFDLAGKLPFFTKISIKRSLFQDCLEKKVIKTIDINTEKYSVFVPEEIHDLLVRYVEYVEYYPETQSKIKHLTYITKATSDEEKRLSFLSNLANYISKINEKKKVNLWEKNKILILIRKIIRKLKHFIYRP